MLRCAATQADGVQGGAGLVRSEPIKIYGRDRLICHDKHSFASDVISEQLWLLQEAWPDVDGVCSIAQIYGHRLHRRLRRSSTVALQVPKSWP